MREEKRLRKKNVPIIIEDPEIGTIYIKRVINNGLTYEPVIRFIKQNKEIRKICEENPNVVIKIKYKEYTPSDFWEELKP